MSTRPKTLAVLVAVAIAGTVWSAGPRALAQDKPVQSTTEQAGRERSSVPLKVTVTISRYQGDKRTGSLPFILTLNSGERTSLRMGSEVPVPSKDGFSYRSIGTQIDCNSGPMLDDGRVRLSITVNDNQISTDGVPSTMSNVPRFQNFISSTALLLRDGQTMQYTAATDKTSGEVVRIDVLLNIVK